MAPDMLLRRHPREALRWLRGRLGLTQAEFARMLGVRGRSVGAWEAGRPPASATRARLVILLALALAIPEGRARLVAVIGPSPATAEGAAVWPEGRGR